MNKKIRKLLNILLVFGILFSTIYMPTVKAATQYIINANATGTKCTIKSLPQEEGTWGYWHYLDAGDAITLDETVPAVVSTNPVCGSSYYKGTYGNTTGYICGDYINFTSVGTYDQFFRDLGFPDSYLPSLNVLKTLHPNWVFTAFQTGIVWNDALVAESTVGKSLISTKNQGYLSTADASYDYKTDVFRNNFDGPSWYAANSDTIRFYLDPRNFLNAVDILMFETQSYSTSHSITVVQSILSDTFMSGNYIEKVNDVDTPLSYAQAFMDAGLASGVSPYLLSARVKQEVGIKGSGSTSGLVAGYEGYYNFFNINAYATTDTSTGVTTDAVTNGLIYAKSRGWNTITKSIVEGSSFLGNQYIANGQNTLYLQKWDLVGNLYTHQYMTNITAPKSETASIYNAYTAGLILNNDLIFNIPVFLDMPLTQASLPNPGNPNNYLNTFSINGVGLTGFSGDVTDYSYNFSVPTSSIALSGSTVNSKATVVGLGNVLLTSKTQIFPVVVKAENGATRTYNFTFTKPDEIPIDPAEVAIKLPYTNDGTYIDNIPVTTSVNVVNDLVKSINTLASAVIKDSNGNEVANRGFATGDKIVITSNNAVKEYIVTIFGDVNGDGYITIADLLRVQKIILNDVTLSAPYLRAADVSRGGTVDILDLLKVQKHILGVASIEQ